MSARDFALAIASGLRLDLEQFTPCLDDQTHLDQLIADAEDAAEIGVFGTPTIFVNGRVVSAFPLEAIIDAVLAAAE